jgi:hypothetical protein
MLQCEECGCVSESARAWFGYIAEDPEDGEGGTLTVYCPPCAIRELNAPQRLHYYV